MLNTCENRVYISHLLWGSRLAENWPQISCSWTNRNVWGYLRVGSACWLWGFHRCDAMQGEWWGWCGILWDAGGGSGEGPPVWEMGISFPALLLRSLAGSFRLLKGCFEGQKEEMQLLSPKSKMLCKGMSLRPASALRCVPQMRWESEGTQAFLSHFSFGLF